MWLCLKVRSVPGNIQMISRVVKYPGTEPEACFWVTKRIQLGWNLLRDFFHIKCAVCIFKTFFFFFRCIIFDPVLISENAKYIKSDANMLPYNLWRSMESVSFKWHVWSSLHVCLHEWTIKSSVKLLMEMIFFLHRQCRSSGLGLFSVLCVLYVLYVFGFSSSSLFFASNLPKTCQLSSLLIQNCSLCVNRSVLSDVLVSVSRVHATLTWPGKSGYSI